MGEGVRRELGLGGEGLPARYAKCRVPEFITASIPVLRQYFASDDDGDEGRSTARPWAVTSQC